MAIEDSLTRETKKLTQFLMALISKVSGITLEKEEKLLPQIKNRLLDELGLDLEEFLHKKDEEIIKILEGRKLNLDHLELFADFLIKLDIKYLDTINPHQKALAIYKYIQQNNTTFSLPLQQKIALLHKTMIS